MVRPSSERKSLKISVLIKKIEKKFLKSHSPNNNSSSSRCNNSNNNSNSSSSSSHSSSRCNNSNNNSNSSSRDKMGCLSNRAAACPADLPSTAGHPKAVPHRSKASVTACPPAQSPKAKTG